MWIASLAVETSSPGTTRSLRFISLSDICLTVISLSRQFKKVALCLCWCLQVRYECLSDEIKIGDYYLRLLLEEDENEETNAIKRSWDLRYIRRLSAANLSFCIQTKIFFSISQIWILQWTLPSFSANPQSSHEVPVPAGTHYSLWQMLWRDRPLYRH